MTNSTTTCQTSLGRIRLSMKEFWFKLEINEAQGLKSCTSVLNKHRGGNNKTFVPEHKTRCQSLRRCISQSDGLDQLVSYKTTQLVCVMETLHHGDPIFKSWKVIE